MTENSLFDLDKAVETVKDGMWVRDTADAKLAVLYWHSTPELMAHAKLGREYALRVQKLVDEGESLEDVVESDRFDEEESYVEAAHDEQAVLFLQSCWELGEEFDELLSFHDWGIYYCQMPDYYDEGRDVPD